jgi:hypothetical protein
MFLKAIVGTLNNLTIVNYLNDTIIKDIKYDGDIEYAVHDEYAMYLTEFPNDVPIITQALYIRKDIILINEVALSIKDKNPILFSHMLKCGSYLFEKHIASYLVDPNTISNLIDLIKGIEPYYEISDEDIIKNKLIIMRQNLSDLQNVMSDSRDAVH